MKNVLVTGAGRGIGKEIAIEFAKNGYRVFVNYNKSEDEAKKTAAQTGGVAVKADISNYGEVRRMSEFIRSRYGKIDVLVNNAGISQIKLFNDITEADWDRMFDVNIKGMYLVTREFAKDMISEKKGKIINISSMWGISGGSCEVHYSASKAAVIGFTKALAKELGPSGINVNCVAPGVIDTEMNNHLSEDDLQALRDETPLGKTGTAADVAKTVYFLASGNADFITGQVIGVDGGIIV